MARPSQRLIAALRASARKINDSENYQWGHMGACNCGFLTQELTTLTKREIHEYAMRGKGDWSEQVDAFCPTSQMPMDLLISELIGAGLSLTDLINLERLKDPSVLSRIHSERRMVLQHNQRADVALYLESWADLLSEQMEKAKPKEVLTEA